MRVTFYSNFLNHHQLPFCLEMYERLGENFKFVATEPINKERLLMGYEDMTNKYPAFTVNAYSSSEAMDFALRLSDTSDIVIIGSAPEIYINDRIRKNKLIFRYSERIFKKGRFRIFNPKTAFTLVKNHTILQQKKVYMLCASAYTASDFRLVNAYKGKAFTWGYFPEVKEHNLDSLMSNKNGKIPKILWVGRLIDWKHPEVAVEVAHMLKNQSYQFEMEIIGTGPLESKLKELINYYNLSENVRLLGSMHPELVREHMEAANIYIFTSDFNEGWGAVLNESMNSGCAVIASHAIGSVPLLMKHKRNGYVYKNGDIKEVYEYTKQLIEDRELCENLGREGYRTLMETWNAKIATERFLQLAYNLLCGEGVDLHDYGPCSRALNISQSKVYSFLIRNSH